MKKLCDVNLLLALCYERHEHHLTVLTWLDEQARQDVAICRITQLGLLRLLCNASIMGASACTLQQAWDIYDTVLSDERFVFVHEPDTLEIRFRDYAASAHVSPKLWQDAYLAAFAHESKMHMATFDSGFRQFDGLRLNLLKN